MEPYSESLWPPDERVFIIISRDILEQCECAE